MKPLDYMTLFALFAGPAIAVGIQLWFTNRAEDRRRKLAILDTLMSYRGRILHSDSVRAINTIDVVFYDCPNVRQKFITFLTHMDAPEWSVEPVPPQTVARSEDLLTELLSEMCKAVGYGFDHTQIKAKHYSPRAFADDEQYTRDVRTTLLPILRGDRAIKVNTE